MYKILYHDIINPYDDSLDHNFINNKKNNFENANPFTTK